MSNLLKLETQFNWEIWECALSYLEPIIDILRHLVNLINLILIG